MACYSNKVRLFASDWLLKNGVRPRLMFSFTGVTFGVKYGVTERGGEAGVKLSKAAPGDFMGKRKVLELQ